MKRALIALLIIGAVVLVGLQLIPVNRTNPPVTREIQWDSPETRALAQRACFDCHSNETQYPFYAYIAPPSLLLNSHVAEGRDHMNFSEWDEYFHDFDEIEEMVTESKMPPWDYLLLHPEARLSDAEKAQLLAGLEATIAADPGE